MYIYIQLHIWYLLLSYFVIFYNKAMNHFWIWTLTTQDASWFKWRDFSENGHRQTKPLREVGNIQKDACMVYLPRFGWFYGKCR